jgi:hypothetical protein
MPAFCKTGWLEFGALQTQEGTTKRQQSVYQNEVSSPKRFNTMICKPHAPTASVRTDHVETIQQVD